MKSRARWMIWLPLLTGAAWLAVFGDKAPAHSGISLPTRDAPAEDVTPRKAGTAPPATESVLRLLPRAQRPPGPQRAETANPFAPRQWTAPPPVAAAPVAPPPPAAPPLPYVFLGKKQEAGAWEVYLGRGDQSFVVREGQMLEGQYRVTRIAPPQLTLIYLPLDLAQTLPIGDVL